MNKPFAIVTGASSGIGLELAVICAQEGFDLLVAADRPEIHAAAERFRTLGAQVAAVATDLATTAGVDRLWAAVADRPVDALLANAGHGLGRAFLDQDFEEVRHVIDTNITGTVYLVQLVGRTMRSQGGEAEVARVGFDAMMRGDGDVVSGWKNKLQSAIANVTPAGVLAEQHRRMAEPGSATKAHD
jgi:short-subunit dehydrogenase